MALTGINLSSPILVGVNKPLDAKQGPFPDVATALAEIGSSLRYPGLTVIINGLTSEDYYFRDGIADLDLIPKIPSLDLQAICDVGSVTTTSLTSAGLYVDIAGDRRFYMDSTGLYTEGYGLDSNFVLGKNSGNTTITGDNNLLIGENSGNALTSGYQNTIIGQLSGAALTSGWQNIAIGYAVLPVATTANRNVAIGHEALNAVTSGQRMTAIGRGAGRAITTGGDHVFIGYEAGADITTGIRNTFIGAFAGRNASVNNALCVYLGDSTGTLANGSACTYLGTEAGREMVGHNNIVIGRSAFRYMSGDDNIIIGTEKEASTVGTVNNKLMIGELLLGDLASGNLIINPGAYTDTTTFNLDVKGTINALTNYAVGGINGYTGTVNIDQSHLPAPPIVITIEGGIITNVT